MGISGEKNWTEDIFEVITVESFPKLVTAKNHRS